MSPNQSLRSPCQPSCSFKWIWHAARNNLQILLQPRTVRDAYSCEIYPTAQLFRINDPSTTATST